MKEYKTGALTITLRPDGIVHASNNEDWTDPDTLTTIKKDIAAIKEVFGGQPNRAILFEVPNRHIEKKLLDCYQAAEWGEVARALLLTSYGAKVIGNLYLKLSKEKPNEAGRIVPMKLFTKKEVAEAWLFEQIDAAENK
ncbi:MAG: Unknown protein [uncultured Aureispira sp.]|uniref:STAS/SEC14 domain-containing protein n=1 Tax=uncultured Aureispira sp. TaxID=1331704 RepID=A0A6S6SND7_9BACT|nr:MAG: Unknown protein [uncultured Aureispira sp.]